MVDVVIKVVKAGVDVFLGSQLDRESVEYRMSRRGGTVGGNDNNNESVGRRKSKRQWEHIINHVTFTES